MAYFAGLGRVLFMLKCPRLEVSAGQIDKIDVSFFKFHA